LAVQLGGLLALVLLVHEPPHPDGRRRFLASVRGVPAVIVDCVRLVRRSRVLAALLAVELCWGFGMITWEKLMPVRLSEEVGGFEQAAAITGPASSAAWLASAAGAALIPLLSARIGVAWTGFALRIVQGLAVLGMGLLAGPVGVLTGFLAAYLLHGAANPVHMTLIHHEVDSSHRSTAVSLNSMVAQPAASLGAIVLTALATGTSVAFAIVVGAVVLAVAAPLYLPAAKAEKIRSNRVRSTAAHQG
jgi:predicted MFS family arabinose efflux permease